MSLNDNPVGSLGVGRVEIQKDDVAVPLSATPVPCVWVIVYAIFDVVVGGAGVTRESEEAETELEGLLLKAGESITIPVGDLNALYINGPEENTVSFLYGIA